MYLTRFRLNTARSGARKLLASPQAMHAAVMSSFPTLLPSDTSGPRVLWRVDRTSRAEVFLYIVSPPEPDLTHLVEQAGWSTQPEWQTHDYAPFLSRLARGDVWAFRLTANPVHSIRRKPGEPTKLTAHVTPRHQMGWLLSRQDAAGFRVVEKPVEQRRLPQGDEYELVVHNRQNRAFTKKTSKDGLVSLVTATFDGRLEVTDPDALRRTLTTGLGRAKAYGCGLMTLAPADSDR
ncbi:type I-E CRISPR-associated protein Cas6/Cse3/CasE [Thermobifida halotolerans]|uniref:Type I-E CRISPR-associated protein Cas6/Cse3/CasE n=1 Tax=Thermobifida halotolerans TaxID=483545 RepID=A0A399FTG4_9ACTN|nr:type I-E CRISPR-associated protein Cas6/Cse3/CasE [Thermobifida halotolerans]UOE22156.1 type I-E CRISPR-associated protein Cas6/Cse3/CasE [Thermobifida halotolerans]